MEANEHSQMLTDGLGLQLTADGELAGCPQAAHRKCNHADADICCGGGYDVQLKRGVPCDCSGCHGSRAHKSPLLASSGDGAADAYGVAVERACQTLQLLMECVPGDTGAKNLIREIAQVLRDAVRIERADATACRFICVQGSPIVMRGDRRIARACSNNYALRIANALNAYTPTRRGR